MGAAKPEEGRVRVMEGDVAAEVRDEGGWVPVGLFGAGVLFATGDLSFSSFVAAGFVGAFATTFEAGLTSFGFTRGCSIDSTAGREGVGGVSETVGMLTGVMGAFSTTGALIDGSSFAGSFGDGVLLRGRVDGLGDNDDLRAATLPVGCLTRGAGGESVDFICSNRLMRSDALLARLSSGRGMSVDGRAVSDASSRECALEPCVVEVPRWQRSREGRSRTRGLTGCMEVGCSAVSVEREAVTSSSCPATNVTLPVFSALQSLGSGFPRFCSALGYVCYLVDHGPRSQGRGHVDARDGSLNADESTRMLWTSRNDLLPLVHLAEVHFGVGLSATALLLVCPPARLLYC